MSQNGESKDTGPTTSFWSAVTEVIRGLRRQPALLFGFGMAIILLAAGTLALENLRLVAGTLLLLVVLAMVGWIAAKALELRSNQTQAQAAQSRAKGGSVKFGRGVKASGNTISSGSVTIGGVNKDVMEGGDVTVGSGTELKDNIIRAGRVTDGNSTEPEDNKINGDKVK